MPLYKYTCPKCGESVELLRSIEDRDKEVECPACGTKMVRDFPKVAIEIRYETGLAQVKPSCCDKTIWLNRHDNWKPPKEYLQKKGLPPVV